MAIIQSTTDDNESYLAKENQRLKSMLNAVIDKVEKNEVIHKKFQHLEFDLLGLANLPTLLHTLTTDFKSSLDVDAVSLQLHDPYHNIQDLLRDVYSSIHIENIEFNDSTVPLEQLYEFGLRTQLRQKNRFLAKQLFPGLFGIESMAMLPLVRNGNLIGSYHLGSRNVERFSPEMSVDFIDHFAHVIAICLENTVNIEKLKHLSLIDPLTRTRNRRSLHQALKQEVARAERESLPLSCLFIDLDHFKQINDEHGHTTGDNVLVQMAKVIQPNLRTTDLLARFGGEEFVVLLPNCNQSVARNIAERIRIMVEKQTLISESNSTFRITCSLGGTTWHPQTQPLNSNQITKQLLSTADQAVYDAKDYGRNQVRWREIELPNDDS